ncbi:MAG: ribosome maturation factor RimP [Candidatus Marinimicrobia bacterium]|nr:ribosome maturation factor RimP [Candidatus Neomarinimicrobiota bacterium]
MMTIVKEKVKAVIEQIVEESGAYLVDFAVTLQGKRSFFKVVIQTLSGITLDEIASITKTINSNEVLDQLFNDGYHLEVSSPGIDSKLTEYRDFPRNIGRTLKIYHMSSSMKSPINGILVEVTEEKLVLDIKGVQKALQFSDLDYAKIEIKW